MTETREEARTCIMGASTEHPCRYPATEPIGRRGDAPPASCAFHAATEPLVIEQEEMGVSLELVRGYLKGARRHPAAAPLVDALEREAARLDIMLPVLIQVNVAREAQKSGCAPEEAASVLDAILASHHLRCDGLMTIAPLVADAEDARPAFRGLRELRDRLESSAEVRLPTLSMGMSNDYAIAVAEGATHLRLGRAIFGSR